MSAEQHVELAKEYLESAKRAYGYRDYRSVSVLAIMAAEMAGRALLILRGLTRPKSHGVLPALIGREFVAKGEISRETGMKLHIIMEKRGRIFYEPTLAIGKEEAEELMAFTEEFVEETARFIEKSENTK